MWRWIGEDTTFIPPSQSRCRSKPPSTYLQEKNELKDWESRARAAYIRRLGPTADQPSIDVDEAHGVVKLYNVNGVLGAYRITARRLRWDEKLPRQLHPKWNHEIGQ